MMKKWTCLLCAVLLTVSLTGCISVSVKTEEQSGLAGISDRADEAVNSVIAESEVSGQDLPEETPEEAKPDLAGLVSDPNKDQQMSQMLMSEDIFEGRDDISYVLIYNPALWDENNKDMFGFDNNDTLTTGDIGSQIDINAGRAGELEESEYDFEFYTQPGIGDLPEGMELNAENQRAGELQPIYEEGDTKEFYIGNESRSLETLECLYAGEYCYIWSFDGSISEEQAQHYGEEFDTVIYPADVETFGTARYTDEGGKINILYYDFNESGFLGFFRGIDLRATGEVAEELIEEYGINLNQAIINVNSAYCDEEFEDVIFSTQAHEFQHLINYTDFFESYYNSNGQALGCTDSWLNEAMSGYIEEKLYPGIKMKEGHYQSFAQSDLIRGGQSMYHFGTGFHDIGVYGSAFLFTQYLEQRAGESIFHEIHDYYRSGDHMDLTTPTVLYNTVPEEMVKEIEESYTYPEDLVFENDAQEWVSKMILDYYLSLLCFDIEDPIAYIYVDALTLLYDEINPADIEGGGRVIAATMNGTFAIPEDADYGLIYIGLDADFNPVTGICYK